MAKDSFQEAYSEVKAEMEEAGRLLEEKRKLQWTNPDSPRIAALEAQIAILRASSRDKIGGEKKKLREGLEAIEKSKLFGFDLQKQLATLSVTLVVALLALSGVFAGTEGLRAVVRDASVSFLYAVVASVLAMFGSLAFEVDGSIFRASSDASKLKHALMLIVDYAGWFLLKLLRFMRVVAVGAAFYYFFNGLFSLVDFLSKG